MPRTTETRLQELRTWGGFTSFMGPQEHAVGTDYGVIPVAQVVGIAADIGFSVRIRTIDTGEPRSRLGIAPLRERMGFVRAWQDLRDRALERLTEQARGLGADAIIGVDAKAATHRGGEMLEFEMVLTGTAVRVSRWKRSDGDRPVATRASAQELGSLLRAGFEPAGIAGGTAYVEATVGATSRQARRAGRRVRSQELVDVTRATNEARRLAVDRLAHDAKRWSPDGVVGVEVRKHSDYTSMSTYGLFPWPGGTFDIEVHAFGDAVRRRRDASIAPRRVVRMGASGG